jgi:hypothetical protein
MKDYNISYDAHKLTEENTLELTPWSRKELFDQDPYRVGIKTKKLMKGML